MAMGEREEDRQQAVFVSTSELSIGRLSVLPLSERDPARPCWSRRSGCGNA